MVLKKQLEQKIETLKFSVRTYKGQHTKMKKKLEYLQEVVQRQATMIEILEQTKSRKQIPIQVQQFIKKHFPNMKLF